MRGNAVDPLAGGTVSTVQIPLGEHDQLRLVQRARDAALSDPRPPLPSAYTPPGTPPGTGIGLVSRASLPPGRRGRMRTAPSIARRGVGGARRRRRLRINGESIAPGGSGLIAVQGESGGRRPRMLVSRRSRRRGGAADGPLLLMDEGSGGPIDPEAAQAQRQVVERMQASLNSSVGSTGSPSPTERPSTSPNATARQAYVPVTRPAVRTLSALVEWAYWYMWWRGRSDDVSTACKMKPLSSFPVFDLVQWAGSQAATRRAAVPASERVPRRSRHSASVRRSPHEAGTGRLLFALATAALESFGLVGCLYIGPGAFRSFV